MVPAGSSPGSPRPASALPWSIPPVLIAASVVAATVLVPSGARVAVAWCGLVATVAVSFAAAAVVRRNRELDVVRRRAADRDALLRRRLVEQEAETVRLAEELLPWAVGRLQQGAQPEEVLRNVELEGDLDPEFEVAHKAVLRSVLEAVSAEEDLRESAQRAFVNIARRVQAIIHQQALDLREMEDRHGRNPEVFGDLLKLDHGTALVGRLADSIAVLGGSRPGRQWGRAVPLFSVLRGAMSRIVDYKRVELHSVTEVAVVGPGVEPLIHALAELLDNATRYSPPQTRVHLTAIEVQAGIAVEIEDGGVGLSEEAQNRAERVLLQAATTGIDLNDLGETPRLGLSVVGRLAQDYGFKISLRPSAYGGVRAVLIVPPELITTAPATGQAHGIGASSGPRPATAAPRPAMPRPASGPVASHPAVDFEDDVPIVTERTANGLPQRRRRIGAPLPRPASAAAPVTASHAPAKTEESVQPGMWLADFMSGVNGETPATAPVRQNSDESLDEGE